MANKHVLDVIDPYDERPHKCRGCGAEGSDDKPVTGECPTPYVEPTVRIAQLEKELALAVAQRDRFAEALKDVVVASGIPLDDCSLEPGPDLLALSMDLVRRFGEMLQ